MEKQGLNRHDKAVSQSVQPYPKQTRVDVVRDAKRCLGCHTCELACAAAHSGAGSVVGGVLAGERLLSRNRVVQVDTDKLSTQCRQCEDAPCAKVCPTHAVTHTGTCTIVDERLCIACRRCVRACPFCAIHVATATVAGRDQRAAFKCDLCAHRLKGPACVESCPTKALSLQQPLQIMQQPVQAGARQRLDAPESLRMLASA